MPAAQISERFCLGGGSRFALYSLARQLAVLWLILPGACSTANSGQGSGADEGGRPRTSPAVQPPMRPAVEPTTPPAAQLASRPSGRMRSQYQEEQASGPDGPVEIGNMEVHYGAVDRRGAWPGYFAPGSQTFYRWRNVSIPIDEVPNQGLTGRVPLLRLDRGKLRVVHVNPPVQFLRLGDGTAAPGYYDYGAAIFYRWKGVVIDERNVPLNPAVRHPILEKKLDRGTIEVREIEHTLLVVS